MVSYSSFVYNYSKYLFKREEAVHVKDPLSSNGDISSSSSQTSQNPFNRGYEAPLSADYKVFLNGNEVPVYTCRTSAYPFNRVWPGFQRSVDQTEISSYVNLVSDEEITLEVIPTKKNYKKIMLKPYSKNVAVEDRDGKITFVLKENGAYMLELDDYHGLLYIFNNKPVICNDPASVTYYFGPGVYFAGRIALKSNESIYVDKDALIFGSVFAEGAENIRVFGNGVFDNSNEERFFEACYEHYTNGNLKFYECKNIKLQGVGYTNSSLWCVNLFGCSDVEIDGINVFGQWRYNTDGIDVVNCQSVNIRNSFVHSFDDTITIKGIDRYAHLSNTDMLIENCVLLCDWGKTLELGLETNAPEYRNIVFKNCDLLRAGNTACDIQHGDSADIHDIVFDDIRVELESFYSPEVYQSTDDQIYDKQDVTAIPLIVNFINHRRFAEMTGIPLSSVLKEGDSGFAAFHDILVKDIKVYCDDKILKNMGTKCVGVCINNAFATSNVSNIRIENITLNGKPLVHEDIDIEITTAAPIKDLFILD